MSGMKENVRLGINETENLKNKTKQKHEIRK